MKLVFDIDEKALKAWNNDPETYARDFDVLVNGEKVAIRLPIPLAEEVKFSFEFRSRSVEDLDVRQYLADKALSETPPQEDGEEVEVTGEPKHDLVTSEQEAEEELAKIEANKLLREEAEAERLANLPVEVEVEAEAEVEALKEEISADKSSDDSSPVGEADEAPAETVSEEVNVDG